MFSKIIVKNFFSQVRLFLSEIIYRYRTWKTSLTKLTMETPTTTVNVHSLAGVKSANCVTYLGSF